MATVKVSIGSSWAPQATMRLALSVLLLICCAAIAVGQNRKAASGPAFDHLTTGFELTGGHRDLRCESCHVDAVFKGTPRECARCHERGARIGASARPASHVLSSDRCADCHTTTAWVPASRFDHSQVRGSCASCHDGMRATGKPASHVQTAENCDVCHTTGAWAPARFDHSGITANCA
ncbi:MAG: cytochrome c3 family protein, partial [Steroidobacteraceae bacterium]